MNQQQLQTTLETATAALAAQQQIVAECKTRHQEATESHQRAQKAIDLNTDESEDLIIRLTSDAAKAKARCNVAAQALTQAQAPLAELQAAVTQAQQALSSFLHEESCSRLTRFLETNGDRLRTLAGDLTGLLTEARVAAAESATAQGLLSTRADHLWLLHVRSVLQGVNLDAITLVTNAVPQEYLAFSTFGETPSTGRNDASNSSTECVELALKGTNPAKVFTQRAAQKQAHSDETWLANNAQRIAELDAKIGAEVAELPTADRIEIMTYRVLRRLQSGEELTPTERAWKALPELRGLHADQRMVSTWSSDDAVLMDKLIEWRNQTAREALARKAS
jgi:hypothetical protein